MQHLIGYVKILTLLRNHMGICELHYRAGKQVELNDSDIKKSEFKGKLIKGAAEKFNKRGSCIFKGTQTGVYECHFYGGTPNRDRETLEDEGIIVEDITDRCPIPKIARKLPGASEPV